jgi:hypothetical protein
MANFTQEFLNITYLHQDKIIYNIGSHVHRVALKAPMSSNHTYINHTDSDGKITDQIKDFDLKIYASPSISPVYYNNPGYSFLHLDEELKVEEITLHFLRLYLRDNFFGTKQWNEY